MTKVLMCRDLMPGCAFQARGGDLKTKILAAAGAHAQEVHNLDVTPQLVAQVRSVIRDEPAPA